MKKLLTILFAVLFSSAVSAQLSAVVLEPYAVHDGSISSLEGMITYRLYAVFSNEDDQLSEVYGDAETPLILSSSSGFYYSELINENFGWAQNPVWFNFFPFVEYDSWITIGADTQVGYGAQNYVGLDLDNFAAGGDLIIDSADGGSWFTLQWDEAAQAGNDLKVLLAQLTVTSGSDITGTLNIQFFVNGDQDNPQNAEGIPISLAGCTDESACNFDLMALVENGSCVYPIAGYDCEGNCLSDMNNNGICDFDELEALENSIVSGDFCGEGTVWDFELEQCLSLNLCQEDLDGDGVIGINDLMELLSSFGTMCEEPETGEFTCGDAMNYHGYDYATVQIGGQCWFAENLRNEHYANGDAIPGELSNSEWSGTSNGAQAIYDNSPANLADYGRLYNWYAVDDSRGLCPSGWHVPTDGEYTILPDGLGGTSVAGGKMKSSPEDSPSWNGTNTSGFSGLAGGLRSSYGHFNYQGDLGYFWSATGVGNYSYFSRLESNTGFYQNNDHQRVGFSVRCVRD